MRATAGTAVQRVEQPSTLRTTRSESLLDTVDEMFDSIARRAFDIFESNGRALGRDLDDWFKAEAELLHPVHITLTESGDTVEVKAEVPGFSEKQLEISVEPRRLTIVGKREFDKEEKKGKTIYSTRCSDQLLRIVDLPTEVETDKVTATLKNGILNLAVPKAARSGVSRSNQRALEVRVRTGNARETTRSRNCPYGHYT